MDSRDNSYVVICNSFFYKMRFLTCACFFLLFFFYIIFKCLLQKQNKNDKFLRRKIYSFSCYIFLGVILITINIFRTEIMFLCLLSTVKNLKIRYTIFYVEKRFPTILVYSSFYCIWSNKVYI